MQAKLIIAAIILALGGSLWTAIDAGATTRAELEQQQVRNSLLVQQVASVAKSYQHQLKSAEEAYRVRDSHIDQADKRREAAEERLKQGGEAVREWGATPVHPDATASLCLQAGSCTGGVSETEEAAGGTAGAGTGDAVERQLQLTNDSLVEGIEACRVDLAAANAHILGLRAWCEREIGDCEL